MLRMHGHVSAVFFSVTSYSCKINTMEIIGLSSTTVTKLASKAIEFGEKTQNKGYYAVQCHSSHRSVSIESPYATSY